MFFYFSLSAPVPPLPINGRSWKGRDTHHKEAGQAEIRNPLRTRWLPRPDVCQSQLVVSVCLEVGPNGLEGGAIAVRCPEAVMAPRFH